jgi:hypothetical protein
MRNLQEQVEKTFCYQKLFRPFTVWINCSSDLKIFANSRPSASNFKSFSRSLEHFFLIVGQNNFGNKIPYILARGLHTGQAVIWNPRFWFLFDKFAIKEGLFGELFKSRNRLQNILMKSQMVKHCLKTCLNLLQVK